MRPPRRTDALLHRLAGTLVAACLATAASAATIRGQVVDAVDGSPLADAAILVDSAVTATLRTDAEGRFEVQAPGPEVRIRASAAPRLYLDGFTRLQDLAPGATVEGVVLALGRAARVSGQVRRADGSAVAFAEVALVGPPPNATAWNPARVGTTDVEGRYRIDRVAPGDYVVHARSSGVLIGQATGGVECPQLQYCPRERIDTITLAGFDDIGGVDFTLRPGAIVGGTMRGIDGALLFGSVTAYDAALRPVARDSGPDWELPALPTGAYRLVASSANEGRYLPMVFPDRTCTASGCDIGAGTEVEAVQGITLVDFVQPRAAELRFPIAQASSARPLLPIGDALRIDALRADPGGESLSAYAFCFRYSSLPSVPVSCFLPAGRFRFEARMAGWRDQRFPLIDCEPGGCALSAGSTVDTVPGTVLDMPGATLETIGGVAVWVRGEEGRSVIGVVVEALDADGNRVADSRRNRLSSVPAVDLEPGTYWIRTRNARDYIDHLYPSVPCTPDCDLAAGTPVVVVGDSYQWITIDLGRTDLVARDDFELFPLNQ